MSRISLKPTIPPRVNRNVLMTVMHYEWRMLKADRIARTVILLFVGIIGCALLNGFVTYSRQQRRTDEGGREQRALYDKTKQEIAQVEQGRSAKGVPLTLLKSGVPSASAVYNRLTDFKITHPFDSSAMLNAGLSDSHPLTFAYRTGGRFMPLFPTVGTRSLAGLSPEASTENPMLLLLGQFELAFVTLYIYPLIILVLSFNMMTGDKEAGTLTLILSQPVRLRTVLLGKVAVRTLLVFSIGVILPVVIAQAVTYFLNSYSLSGKSLLVSGLWILASFLYGSFWFGLALVINSKGRNAATNGLVAAVCWIAFTVLVPALVNLGIQYFLPSASSFQFVTEEREASLELNSQIDAATSSLNQLVRARYPLNPGDQTSRERYDKAYFGEPVQLPEVGELLRDFAGEHPEWARAVTPDQVTRALVEIRRTRMEQRLEKALDQAETRRIRQEAVFDTLRFASPTILMHSALNDITGTGNERYKNFLGQLDAYVRQHESFFSAKILKGENVYSGDFDDLPTFRFRDETLADVVRRVRVPITALLILSFCLFLLASRFYRRYSVLR